MPRSVAASRKALAAATVILLAGLCASACMNAERARSARMVSPAAPANAESQANAPGASAEVTRRIIRTAAISLESPQPEEAQRKIAALATSKGGFVVSSDADHFRNEDGEDFTSIAVILRVPVGAFDGTLEALRALATHVSSEKVSGQDVTEEYVDVEARLRAQQAVEDQFLQILRQAKTVHDTLEVQQKLGEVRTEIERAEGRRRYLENQTSLATITVRVARHIDEIESSTPNFGRNLKRAARDSVDVAIGIVNGAIRFVGVMVPITLMLGAPAYLVIRLLARRRRRRKASLSAPPPSV